MQNIEEGVTNVANSLMTESLNLTSVVIADSVTSISDAAFNLCGNLTFITLGKHLLTIGSHAFSKCTGLKSIDLPESLTTIESYAFQGCSSLESVVIPKHVTEIEEEAFDECVSLESVEFLCPHPTLGDSLFYHSVGRTDLPLGNYDDLIKSVKEKFLTLPNDTRVLPGHDCETTIGDEKKNNEFLV